MKWFTKPEDRPWIKTELNDPPQAKWEGVIGKYKAWHGEYDRMLHRDWCDDGTCWCRPSTSGVSPSTTTPQ